MVDRRCKSPNVLADARLGAPPASANTRNGDGGALLGVLPVGEEGRWTVWNDIFLGHLVSLILLATDSFYSGLLSEPILRP